MKRILPVLILMLVASACQGGGSTRTEVDNKIIRLTNELSRVETSALATYDELRRQLKALNERLTVTQGQLSQLETAFSDLDARIRAGALGSNPGDNGGRTIDPPAANAIEETQIALKNLREEKADVADTLKACCTAAWWRTSRACSPGDALRKSVKVPGRSRRSSTSRPGRPG